ncbi:MAG: PfkB family carbohydrate kinase [Verrucomicrobiota bacterium]|jgi:bifunctional ADP-heptose synthase (sugar kinase/adenylyltransferase)|nr:PfkB family carbohydrate kinase [Verrucomicrobiota bacterium]
MSPDRLQEILSKYDQLKIAIVGDFCLDRYFEINPDRDEVSIETGLDVYNITRVRTQAGAAGTVLNNLTALQIPEIHILGFAGNDAEGWLLGKALKQLPGVHMNDFITTERRQTFTYTKPLICEPGKPPRELNRLDQKNWDTTPLELSLQHCSALRRLASHVDAIIVMDQVDIEGTGVVTQVVRECVADIQQRHPELLIMADSRRGLSEYPPMTFKMNATELSQWLRDSGNLSAENVMRQASCVADETGHPVFVSMAEHGIVGASPGLEAVKEPSLMVRGPVDIVGAGDAVTANLCAAIASGATQKEAMLLAMRAASCVIHQLGTTGTASRKDLEAGPTAK